MPTRQNANLLPPTDDNEFEELLRDLCEIEWGDPGTVRNGRKGQKQTGVDVYGRLKDMGGVYRGVQCKVRSTRKTLSKAEIEYEVNEAENFPHRLDRLIIATTLPRDTNLQRIVDEINDDRVQLGKFAVGVWFWEDVSERLATTPKLYAKYYRDLLSTLTLSPQLESFIDTPLLLLTSGVTEHDEEVLELLRFRGLRVSNIEAPLLQPPADGILMFFTDGNDQDVFRFVAELKGQVDHNADQKPIFVISSSEFSSVILDAAAKLELPSDKFQVLDSGEPSAVIADKVFKVVFEYGFHKRGAIPVIDLSVRSIPTPHAACLLDMDWQSRLRHDEFPTNREWESVFVPAIRAVSSQVLSLGDLSRVQIASALPIPAAIAIGHYFNIRLANVGVWARRTGSSDFKHQYWLSNSDGTQIKYPVEWEMPLATQAKTAVVELSTYLPISADVHQYVADQDLQVDSWASVTLQRNQAPPENLTEGEAVAFANQIGQLLRELNSSGVKDIHLFGRIPSALAVLIGQRTLACGTIHLYWYASPSYLFAFSLNGRDDNMSSKLAF